MIFSDWRRLTENEVRMAKQVFADSINFHHIKIYRGIPLIPNANTAIAPNGNIYFPRKHCPDDFTQAGIAYKIWLIHELTHVWQHQRGHKSFGFPVYSSCSKADIGNAKLTPTLSPYPTSTN